MVKATEKSPEKPTASTNPFTNHWRKKKKATEIINAYYFKN
jgi:hypothetical protein